VLIVSTLGLYRLLHGVNVQVLNVHAEKALTSLLARNVPVDLFGARRLRTRAGPREIFSQTAAGESLGVRARREGTYPGFAAVRERVVAQKAMQSRARALHPSMRLLVGQVQVQGIALDAADSPQVQ
jgi:hypothetical protein